MDGKWKGLVAGVMLLAAAPAWAQTGTGETQRPLVLEGHIGHASFADESPVPHAVFGVSARKFITPRLAIGPELTHMRGPGIDRDWFVTGNATFDLLSAVAGPRVTPYVLAGAGYSRTTLAVGTGPYSSSEGAFTAGGGVRISPTPRWYIAPELRLGWELHWRAGVTVGLLR